MSEEFFLIIYLFIIIGSQISGGKKLHIEDPKCIQDYDSLSYWCQDINNNFPSNNNLITFRRLICNLNCKFPTFSNRTFPYQENDVKYFNISKSSINNIEPYAFVNLQHLQLLDLSYNNISNIPNHSFDSLQKLNELHLQHSKIKLLQPGFLDSSQIEQVNISYNNINELLSETFRGSDLLIHLELQHNKINNLRYRSFMHLATLEYLDLGYNYICHLPIGVFHWLHTLRELNLEHNMLSKFELGTFSGLKMLETLNLAHNKFKDIDASNFMTLDGLRHLDLSFNIISESSIINSLLPRLNSISIDDNIISCDKLKEFVAHAKLFKIRIVNTVGRFEIRNINGIACTIVKPTSKVNFDSFLQKVERESKYLEMQNCNS